MSEEREPETVGELFGAPRRTGTPAEHRFVGVPVGKYDRIVTVCRDCGYQRLEWWNSNIEAKNTPCEPDKFKPGWVIYPGSGGYITRVKINEHSGDRSRE